MKKLTVYLDMDGVIADFHTEYLRIKGDPEWCDVRFADLVKTHKVFEHLEWMAGGELLFRTLRNWHDAEDLNLEILSSCGTWNTEVAAMAAQQKTAWLDARGGAAIKKNFVNSFACKKQFSKANTVLIDDRADVIQQFNEGEGVGILYTSKLCFPTLSKIDEIITNLLRK